VYLYILYYSFSILCNNSYCLRQIIKKAELHPISEKKKGNSTSFPSRFRDFSFEGAVGDWH